MKNHSAEEDVQDQHADKGILYTNSVWSADDQSILAYLKLIQLKFFISR